MRNDGKVGWACIASMCSSPRRNGQCWVSAVKVFRLVVSPGSGCTSATLGKYRSVELPGWDLMWQHRGVVCRHVVVVVVVVVVDLYRANVTDGLAWECWSHAWPAFSELATKDLNTLFSQA